MLAIVYEEETEVDKLMWMLPPCPPHSAPQRAHPFFCLAGRGRVLFSHSDQKSRGIVAELQLYSYQFCSAFKCLENGIRPLASAEPSD